MEHLLHYVWKHKLFPLQILQTTEGLRVEVIDSGLQNSDAGPDFFNAKLKIDGTLWVGNIEIHTHSSDWYRHGHNNDKAYDSVILHVVEEADTEVTCSDGETIPQLALDLSREYTNPLSRTLQGRSISCLLFHHRVLIQINNSFLADSAPNRTSGTKGEADYRPAGTVQSSLGRCFLYHSCP